MNTELQTIGVDIGGTKISAAAFQGGRLLAKHAQPTQSHSPGQQVVDNVIACIEQVFTPHTQAIGIGVPGLVNPDEGIIHKVQNIPAWRDLPLASFVQSHFEVPVVLNNDANCFALGEKNYGQGQPYRHLVALTLGTGLGTGIIINQALYHGVSCGAGEFGSIPYKDANFEVYCSGQFFQHVHQISGQQAFEKAEARTTKSQQIWNEFGHHLGRLMHYILYALAPEAIILGGSVSRAFAYFAQGMHNELHRFPFASVSGPIHIAPTQTMDIALKGAAALPQTQGHAIDNHKMQQL